MRSVVKTQSSRRFGAAHWVGVFIWLALGGCVRSCSCGQSARSKPGSTAVQVSGSQSGLPSSAAPGAVGTAGAGGVGAAAAAGSTASADPSAPAEAPEPSAPAPLRAVTTPPPTTIAEVFPDAPKADERKRLAALQKRLTQVPKKSAPAALATRGTLAKVLPDHLGDFAPRSAAKDGPTMAGDKPLTVVARQYGAGSRSLYVKVTDTAQAGFMRAPLVDRLSASATPENGFLHARFVDGYPAIAQYYSAFANSQVMVLVADRYLVEVRVAPAKSPYEAEEVFHKLGLAALGKK